MSQWDKLISRIYSLPSDARFDELRKILEHYGYTMDGTSGGSSHFTFRKPGCPPITIPKHEPIKKCYVKIVRDVIMHNENSESEDNDENS